jgi:hypothetical protein
MFSVRLLRVTRLVAGCVGCGVARCEVAGCGWVQTQFGCGPGAGWRGVGWSINITVMRYGRAVSPYALSQPASSPQQKVLGRHGPSFAACVSRSLHKVCAHRTCACALAGVPVGSVIFAGASAKVWENNLHFVRARCFESSETHRNGPRVVRNRCGPVCVYRASWGLVLQTLSESTDFAGSSIARAL